MKIGLNSIKVEFEPHIGRIVLNRSEKLNILDLDVLKEMREAMDELENNSNVKVIVIAGAGKAFSAGADIRYLSGAGPMEAMLLAKETQRIADRIESCPKPVIAEINGIALGGGLEIALACDIRVASETAKLGLPEINLGLIPGGGGTQRLPKLIGHAMSKEMILTGKIIDAAEALEIGLLNYIVPQDKLRDKVRQIALEMAGKSPHALKAAKMAINYSTYDSIQTKLEIEANLFGMLFNTSEAKSGIKSFLER